MANSEVVDKRNEEQRNFNEEFDFYYDKIHEFKKRYKIDWPKCDGELHYQQVFSEERQKLNRKIVLTRTYSHAEIISMLKREYKACLEFEPYSKYLKELHDAWEHVLP